MATTITNLDVGRAVLGAAPVTENCTRFSVWAPKPQTIELHLVTPIERIIPLERGDNGLCSVDVEGVSEGARYFFRVNGQDRPDPASRFQPEGVHGPSQVVETRPEAVDRWTGRPLSEYILYELHVATFTHAGTLDAIIPELARLNDLGITAVELMPIAEFPGARNWGYDGVFPYAVHHSYGGPEALRRLTRACHDRGMALVLDVVYNHFGPEGNYLPEFGPYFTARYRTPWGEAINFDGEYSDDVRRYFIENALYWIDCGVDALRLDAVHAIYDRSACPFLRELADAVHAHASKLGRRVYLIAESDLNDARLVLPRERNGYGLDAQWSDDFHHSLHTLLTGEQDSYYQDFGALQQMAEVLRQGWYYAGHYSRSRRRRHGNSPADVKARQLVVYSQNHDQIGNRGLGERLIGLTGFEAAKLAAATVVLSPFLPMLFMGEEYGETAPFLYFVSHTDPELVDAVRKGRRQEFPHISGEDVPDPQDEQTFLRSKLNPEQRDQPEHAHLYHFYAELFRLRRMPVLATPTKSGGVVEVVDAANTIVLRRSTADQSVIVALHFGPADEQASIYLPRGIWSKVLDSADECWGGDGSAVPARIASHAGDADLRLRPWQAVVFTGHNPA